MAMCMDVSHRKKSSSGLGFAFNMSPRQRKVLLCALAIAGTGYGAFRLCNSPTARRKMEKLRSILTSFVRVAEAASASAETVILVSNDFRQFLRSESDEIPCSLKQLFKIAGCDEFQTALIRFSSSITAGILHGGNEVSGDSDSGSSAAAASVGTGLPERMMDKLFSPAGQGFASVVVGSLARNLVSGLFECAQNCGSVSGSDGNCASSNQLGFVERVSSNAQLKKIFEDSIERFVGTAVSVYLDKTMDINTFDQICDSLTNPKYDGQVKDMLMSLVNRAVETLVKTSHKVLVENKKDNLPTGSSCNSDSKSNCGFCNSNSNSNGEIEPSVLGGTGVVPQLNIKPCSALMNKEGNLSGSQNSAVIFCNGDSSSSSQYKWLDKISYTLSIPSNRKLFLEVSGKMAFEMMNSLCQFVLSRLSSFCVSTVPHEITHFGRHLQHRAVIVATICLALCLHVVNRALMFQVT